MGINDNDPHILDAWDEDRDLLGWSDNAPLLGWDYRPPVRSPIDPSDFAIGGPVGERVYLVTATLFQDWEHQAAPVTEPAAPATANHPTASPFFNVEDAPPGSIEIRCASLDFVSRADDADLPSRWFDGRVIDPGAINLTLPLVPVGTSAIDTAFGSVVIDNTDGAYDLVLDQNTAVSQSLKIRCGRVGAAIADFVTILDARIVGIGMTQNDLTIEIQDPLLYAQNLYPTSIYTGLGAEAGDAELEGAMKPVVLGRIWNVSPVLINAVSLIYQVHDGAIAAVTGVFDGGVALTADTNYANYGALSTASIEPGEFATCLALGLIRVGGTPAFALTAHVDGEAAAGVTCRSIATWLVDQFVTQLGLASNATFDLLPEWLAGWVWTEQFTFGEAISRFVGDAGFHWGAGADGTIRALQLLPPDGVDSTVSYDIYDIVSLERSQPPQGFAGIHQRRLVRFGRNWTVQADSLAAAAVHRAGRQRQWKSALATVATTSRNAIDPEILETSLYHLAHAEALATHLLDLHGVPRRMFALETKIFGVLPRLGDTVQVRHPRFGLVGGEFLRVVAIDLRLGAGAMNLLLWG